jgi:hypothetical protein
MGYVDKPDKMVDSAETATDNLKVEKESFSASQTWPSSMHMTYNIF